MSSLFEDVDFTDFYKLYPRHVGKADAEKAFARINEADRRMLMSRLPGWLAQYGQDPKYLPYPATWLRARRWEDEIRDVSQLSNRGHDASQLGVVGVSKLPDNLSGVRHYEAPTEEERLEGLKVLRQCVEKLTANDLRLRLKTIAIRRKGR